MNWWLALIRIFSKPEPEVKRANKKHDCTRLTQVQFDRVMEEHQKVQRYNRDNPKSRIKASVLVNQLNHEFGLDKGQTAYSNIWNGHVDRNSLAPGNTVFLGD